MVAGSLTGARDKASVLYVGSEWVEDATASIESVSSTLRVHSVATASAARRELEARSFGCTVVEYVLPEETGTELLSEFADERAAPPAVLLASEHREPTPDEVVAADLSDYHTVEEFDDEFTALTDTVANLVDRWSPQDHERIRTALAMSDTDAWEYDSRSDRLWWSESGDGIHDLSLEAGSTLDDIIHHYAPGDRQVLRDAFDQVLDEGDPFDEIVRLDTDDQRWIRIQGSPVTDSEDPLVVRGCWQDITDIKHREEQFRMLHSAGQDLMQAASRDEVAETTIEAAKNILGYTRAALRLVDENEAVLRVFATTDENVAAAGERPDYRVDEDVPAARTYRRGEPEVFGDLSEITDEYERGALRSGLYVPIGDHGVFSCGDPELDAYDETDVKVIDILTKLSAAALTRVESDRELRQKKEQLERFTGIVAHDLRTPLNTLFGRVDLAQRTPKDEHFEHIKSELKHMEAMIDDLLTLAQAGRSIDEVEAVSLATVADDAWQRINSGENTLSVEEDVTINADRKRLLQALENIFRNAIDHNESPVSITVGKLDEPVRGGASSTGFFVEDDGSGIPSEKRTQIFDHGYTTSEDGTGFGLSIVRHVAEAHNWSIEITDGPAGGARFEFTNVALGSKTPDK